MIAQPSHRAAVLRLTLPPALAVLLFMAAMYYLILPATHEALLESKRATMRAIVASALSLCERHHAAELAGQITRAQAMEQAAADLRALRYGEDNKDYLWVIDHGPRMVVHPYLKELEGQYLGEHRDPDGVRVFAESVALVDKAGQGYIHYRWQWQDDPERVVPKISFVRGFSPWGWVVGSGIYLDDVQAEIDRSTRQLLWISAGIAALMALLVALSLRQGLLSERLRLDAEAELKRSSARYQALAHAAEEAVWLVVNERVTGANRSACRLFGRDESAMIGLAASDLFAAGAHEPKPGVPHETMLNGGTGAVPALVTVSQANVHGHSAQVVTARDLRPEFLSDGHEQRRREAAEAQLRATQHTEACWLLPVKPLARPAPSLPLTSTRDEVAQALRAHQCGTVLLTAPDGGVVGVLSAADLLRRESQTAYAMMTAPVRRIAENASLAQACEALRTSPGHHLLLEQAGQPWTLVDAKSLLDTLGQSPVRLDAAIARASQEQLADLRQRYLVWLRTMIALGIDPEVLTAEGTRLSDAVLRRCVELCLENLGEPPAPFALLVVGSQGRREMMPGSDQDNALVYADGADPAWYRAFARELVTRYAAAGWPPCQGGTTCTNERWCQPLSAWRDTFSGWITGGSPQDLMEVATFFDLRTVWGESTLTETLRSFALEAAANREVFLHQLTHDTLDFRLPLTPFGAIRTDGTAAGLLDIKGCLMHFVCYARVEALRSGIAACGTGERLRQLAAAGRLAAPFATDALEAWKFLLGLRLQLRSQPNGQDGLDPDSLSGQKLAVLKQALGIVGNMQTLLRQELERKG